jgi:hypothetical protein
LAQIHQQVGVNVFINTAIQITLRPLGIVSNAASHAFGKGEHTRQLAIKLQAVVKASTPTQPGNASTCRISCNPLRSAWVNTRPL